MVAFSSANHRIISTSYYLSLFCLFNHNPTVYVKVTVYSLTLLLCAKSSERQASQEPPSPLLTAAGLVLHHLRRSNLICGCCMALH